MPTYRDLKTQLAKLMEQAEAARAAEIQAVIAEIRNKVAEYGITEKDIFGGRRGRPGKARKHVIPPKYRDPATGVTWSGRGRVPSWIKGSKNRERFLIAE